MLKSFTYVPYIIFSFLMFGLINLDYTVFKDDELFYDLSQKFALSDFLSWRYFTWSSRIFIEAVLFVIVRYNYFWRVLCIALFYVLCALSLRSLLKPKTLLQNILICFMLAALPFCYLKNTGWLATSTNYLFPLIWGILSFKSLYNPKPYFYNGLLLILATFIASSMEQLCAIMITIFGVFFLYYLAKYKKIMWFYAIQIEVCLFNIFLFALCPGNAFRFGREMRNRLPEFAQWGFFARLYKGLSHTMDYFFDEPFCLLLTAINIVVFTLLAYCKKAKPYCIGTLVFSAMTFFLICFWHKNMHIFFIIDNKLGWYYLLFVALFCCLVASLFLFYKNTINFYINVLFVMVGLLSSTILGLSPTLYASSFRIFFYFLFILSVLPLLAIFKGYDQLSSNKKHLILLCLLSFYSYYLVQNINY